MTAPIPATIQDASRDVWQLTGSDLLVLVTAIARSSRCSTKSVGFTRDAAQQHFQRSLSEEDSSQWWYGAIISTRRSCSQFTSVPERKVRYWAS